MTTTTTTTTRLPCHSIEVVTTSSCRRVIAPISQTDMSKRQGKLLDSISTNESKLFREHRAATSTPASAQDEPKEEAKMIGGKWARLEEEEEEEAGQEGGMWERLGDRGRRERDELEMNDFRYLQRLAYRTSKRRRRMSRDDGQGKLRPVLSSTKLSLASGTRCGGPELTRRRLRVRSFIMRKLATLSQILFMSICLVLLSAAISPTNNRKYDTPECDPSDPFEGRCQSTRTRTDTTNTLSWIQSNPIRPTGQL